MIERRQKPTPTRPVHLFVESSKAEVPKTETAPQKKSTIRDWFRKFAHVSAQGVGSPWSFFLAISTILLWGISGPLFGFSDTWQLVINTATTIVTFLMVFLIQNTQNRDARAIHLKLDELLHAVKGARNRLINLEDLNDEEMDNLQKEFERVRKKEAPLECEESKAEGHKDKQGAQKTGPSQRNTSDPKNNSAS
ncbi:MAG: putative small integral rane protein [Verrucomicrobiales bacterium]|nr:putative small integral rane protein [Verrucomicrobiales bacterium]